MYSFTYLLPALFLNATVNQRVDLGTDASGGSLSLFEFETTTIRTEPGFELQFQAEVIYVTNYATTGPDGITQPDLTGTVVPSDGSTPFRLHMGGVQISDATVDSITSGTSHGNIQVPYGASYRILTPRFEGGDSHFKVLEESVFVAEETVSDSGTPGKFLIGVKISKVFPRKTNTTIGHEFP